MNSNKKDFKVGDVWLDGYGKKVTIIKTDLKTIQNPVVGVKVSNTGEEMLATYCSDGTYIAGMRRGEDLVKKYEKPVGPEEIYIYVRISDGWLDAGEVCVKDPGPALSAAWRVVRYRRVDKE